MNFPKMKLPTWDKTVTVLNKLDGRDSPKHLDIWKKTVLKDCFWSGQRTRGRSGYMSAAVEINEGASYLLRVPESPEYHPYLDWKGDMEGFTFSPGDYIILGEMTGEITPETVQSIVESYRPDAFEVQLFKDNTDGPMPHYRLDGV